MERDNFLVQKMEGNVIDRLNAAIKANAVMALADASEVIFALENGTIQITIEPHTDSVRLKKLIEDYERILLKSRVSN